MTSRHILKYEDTWALKIRIKDDFLLALTIAVDLEAAGKSLRALATSKGPTL